MNKQDVITKLIEFMRDEMGQDGWKDYRIDELLHFLENDLKILKRPFKYDDIGEYYTEYEYYEDV